MGDRILHKNDAAEELRCQVQTLKRKLARSENCNYKLNGVINKLEAALARRNTEFRDLLALCRKEAVEAAACDKPPLEKKGISNAAATYREAAAGAGGRDGAASSALVQKVLEENASLRTKVESLERLVLDKSREIEQLRRSSKVSRLHEADLELDECLHEIDRLTCLVAGGRGSSNSQHHHPSYTLFCPRPLPTAPTDLGLVVAATDPRLAPWSPPKASTAAYHPTAPDASREAAAPISPPPRDALASLAVSPPGGAVEGPAAVVTEEAAVWALHLPPHKSPPRAGKPRRARTADGRAGSREASPAAVKREDAATREQRFRERETMFRAARGRVLASQEQRKAEAARQERERVEQARWLRVQELERMLAAEEQEEKLRREQEEQEELEKRRASSSPEKGRGEAKATDETRVERMLKRMEDRRVAERAKIRAARQAWRTHKREGGVGQGPQGRGSVEHVLQHLDSGSDVLDLSGNNISNKKSPDPLASPARRIKFSDEVVVGGHIPTPPTAGGLLLGPPEPGAAAGGGASRPRRPESPSPALSASVTASPSAPSSLRPSAPRPSVNTRNLGGGNTISSLASPSGARSPGGGRSSPTPLATLRSNSGISDSPVTIATPLRRLPSEAASSSTGNSPARPYVDTGRVNPQADSHVFLDTSASPTASTALPTDKPATPKARPDSPALSPSSRSRSPSPGSSRSPTTTKAATPAKDRPAPKAMSDAALNTLIATLLNEPADQDDEAPGGGPTKPLMSPTSTSRARKMMMAVVEEDDDPLADIMAGFEGGPGLEDLDDEGSSVGRGGLGEDEELAYSQSNLGDPVTSSAMLSVITSVSPSTPPSGRSTPLIAPSTPKPYRVHFPEDPALPSPLTPSQDRHVEWATGLSHQGEDDDDGGTPATLGGQDLAGDSGPGTEEGLVTAAMYISSDEEEGEEHDGDEEEDEGEDGRGGGIGPPVKQRSFMGTTRPLLASASDEEEADDDDDDEEEEEEQQEQQSKAPQGYTAPADEAGATKGAAAIVAKGSSSSSRGPPTGAGAADDEEGATTSPGRAALGELLAKGGNVLAGLEEPLLFDDDLDMDEPMQLGLGSDTDDDPL